MADHGSKTKGAAARYMVLGVRRDGYLRRARRASELTIPSLLPPEGFDGTQSLPEPAQGYGARLVTALASKVMTSLLPPGVPFFKLEIPAEVLLQGGQQEGTTKDQERGLAASEQVIFAEVERAKWRRPTYVGMQHLIVAGNVGEQMMEDNSIRVFRLDQYVTVRSPAGALVEFIIEERLTPASVPEELQALVAQTDFQSTTASPGASQPGNTKTIPLFTWGKFDQKKGLWVVHQEVSDQLVPDSRGEFDILPYSFYRWIEEIGEDYGRSKVEEHIGDFRALDGLSQSMVQGAAMASRNVTMIRPNSAGGLNLRRRLTTAENGDYVIGNPEDVEMKQFTNVSGLQFAHAHLGEIRAELGAAFLLNSSVQRDAERVTAFELRKMIEEIETVLGGVFTALAQEIQETRLERLFLQMKRQGKLPPWPEGLVRPTILTGLEALGREKDVERVATALQFTGSLTPEERLYIKMGTLLGKAFNGLGLPNTIRTDAEVKEMREQIAQIEAMAQAGAALASQAAAGQAQPQQ